MNKIILICILLTCVFGVKAQRLNGLQPADSLASPSFKNYFKSVPGINQQLLQPGLNLNKELSTAQTLALNPASFYSRMPVVVLKGYSRMPVAHVNGDDKMPVAKTDAINPGINPLKQLPEIPTYINPNSPIIK